MWRRGGRVGGRGGRARSRACTRRARSVRAAARRDMRGRRRGSRHRRRACRRRSRRPRSARRTRARSAGCPGGRCAAAIWAISSPRTPSSARGCARRSAPRGRCGRDTGEPVAEPPAGRGRERDRVAPRSTPPRRSASLRSARLARRFPAPGQSRGLVIRAGYGGTSAAGSRSWSWAAQRSQDRLQRDLCDLDRRGGAYGPPGPGGPGPGSASPGAPGDAFELGHGRLSLVPFGRARTSSPPRRRSRWRPGRDWAREIAPAVAGAPTRRGRRG